MEGGLALCQCPSKKGRIGFFCFISCLFLGEFLGHYIKYLVFLVLVLFQWVILFVNLCL